MKQRGIGNSLWLGLKHHVDFNMWQCTIHVLYGQRKESKKERLERLARGKEGFGFIVWTIGKHGS